MNTPHEHRIEPLTDDTWQRIEDKVFAQLAGQPAPVPVGSRRAYVPWAALAAACALLGLGFALFSAGGSQPSAAEHFSTSASAQSFVLDDVTLRLEPNTSMSLLRGPDSAVSFTLERGTARFEVAPRHGRAPLAVLAEDVRVEVVGTVFSVARDGGRVSVETYEGTVRVSARGESVLLHRGQRWPATLAAASDGPPPSASTPSALTARDDGLPLTTATPSGRVTHNADLQPSASPLRRATHSEDLQPPAATPSARAMRSESLLPSSPSAARESVRSSVQPLDPSRAASPRARFEAAAACEASDAPKAMQLYEQLARESGSWASNGLFALGRLEVERGLSQKGERHLRRYLRLYPNGPNALDARSLLERAPREPTR